MGISKVVVGSGEETRTDSPLYIIFRLMKRSGSRDRVLPRPDPVSCRSQEGPRRGTRSEGRSKGSQKTPLLEVLSITPKTDHRTPFLRETHKKSLNLTSSSLFVVDPEIFMWDHWISRRLHNRDLSLLRNPSQSNLKEYTLKGTVPFSSKMYHKISIRQSL